MAEDTPENQIRLTSRQKAIIDGGSEESSLWSLDNVSHSRRKSRAKTLTGKEVSSRLFIRFPQSNFFAISAKYFSAEEEATKKQEMLEKRRQDQKKHAANLERETVARILGMLAEELISFNT